MGYGKDKIEFYKYDIFDKLRINIDKAMTDENIEIKKIAENDSYIIYSYKDKRSALSKSYVIGKSKTNLRNVIYLGENFDHVCFYRNNLFKCNNGGELNLDPTLIHRINMDNKIERTYNLRENRGKTISIMGYGRVWCIDNYKSMEVRNDELVISCHREKSNDSKDTHYDRFNKDMDFEIVFRCEDNSLVPYFVADGEEFIHPSYRIESDEYVYEIIKRNQKARKKVDKIKFISDEIMPIVALISILMGIVGIIACLITKFKNPIWIGIIITGIIIYILCDVCFRYVNSRK